MPANTILGGSWAPQIHLRFASVHGHSQDTKIQASIAKALLNSYYLRAETTHYKWWSHGSEVQVRARKRTLCGKRNTLEWVSCGAEHILELLQSASMEVE